MRGISIPLQGLLGCRHGSGSFCFNFGNGLGQHDGQFCGPGLVVTKCRDRQEQDCFVSKQRGGKTGKDVGVVGMVVP